jgi:hypothetical protein
MPTIEEARIRGFLTAKRIKLPHIDRTIELPDDIILKKQGCGNIILEDINGISSFKESKEDSFSWTAIVYFAGSKKWATITQHRELMKNKEHWLDGRYLKVIDDSYIDHYNLKNGDYLLFSHITSVGNEYWGDPTCKEGHYYGYNAHTKNIFELMPEGFVPTIPDKWGVEITPENKGFLEAWWKTQERDHSYSFKGWLLSDKGGIDRSGLCYSASLYGGKYSTYKKISFEEFKAKTTVISKFPVLKEFPIEGVCWGPTKELRDYLSKILGQYSSNTTSKGIAWGNGNHWPVEQSSTKTVYDISQLQPFLITPKEPSKIGWTFTKEPTTANFEIGRYYYVRFLDDYSKFMVTKCTGFNTNDKARINGPFLSNMNGGKDFNKSNTPWINTGREVRLASQEEIYWLDACIEAGKFIELENVKRNPETLTAQLKKGDEFIVDSPGDVINGIKGIVEKIYDNNGIMIVELRRPLPKHPEGGELLAVPLSKVRQYPLTPKDCSFPKKWALKVTYQNNFLLAQFLRDHSYEWKYYMGSWEVSPGSDSLLGDRWNNYFHYPPIGGPAHSDLRINEGYVEITTEQFKQFYKTNNNKEDEQTRNTSSGSTIKVRTTNLEIRYSCEIRATSIRCSKSKISIGG